ncbi:MAG: O-antigen ligase family protein [Flavobacteriales bacterium]|nr:O-antigen ligase family protein [Flavobacteriales bacterium]
MKKLRTESHTTLTFIYLALIFWMPLPLGSNRAWAWSVMELWIFSLGLAVLILYIQNKITLPKALHHAKPILILFLFYLLWLVLQTIPLPASFIETIAPHVSQLSLTQDPTAWVSISANPSETNKVLLLSLSFVIFFILLLILIDTPKKLVWLIYTILAAGLFQATYGSFMVLTGMEYSFFFEKESYRGSATGTFINRNHLAGYLEMILAIGIGFMISKLSNQRSHNWRDRFRHVLHFLLSSKVLIRIALILMCIGLIVTHSRMGNSAFFASLLISGMLFLSISKHASRSTTLFLTSLIILDIVLVGSWVGINKVVNRIEGTSLSSEQRDEVVRDSLTLIAEQPLVGIGAGNFASVFPHFQQQDITLNYYHAHNDYIEFLVESGIVGTVILGLAVLYALFIAIKAMRNRRDPLLLGMAFASFMGILSILIHSFVDFNLQIPANAAMFILLMGLAVMSASMSAAKQHRF